MSKWVIIEDHLGYLAVVGRLTQLVERATQKQEVVGSDPTFEPLVVLTFCNKGQV